MSAPTAAERAAWDAIAQHIAERAPYCEAEAVLPAVLAALATAEGERAAIERWASQQLTDARSAWHKDRDHLVRERDSARDEAAGYRAECERLRGELRRAALTHLTQLSQAYGDEYSDPPDPDTLQQLGLVEDC